MNDTDTSQAIGSLDELEQKAKEAADELTAASSHNAIWDKAAKAIKPGLADKDKVLSEAKKEADLADQLLKSLEDSYDSDVSDTVRTTREAVDAEIESSRQNMSTKWNELNTAKEAAANAKKALDESTANFDGKQKWLMGLPKEIQDKQKQVAALEAEVKDAHTKHQFVEAVVKLEDLKKELAKLNNWLKPEFEAERWQALNAAADDLLQKTDALPVAQAQVPPAEAAYKEAKTKYENEVKNRLDSIKHKLADEEETEEESAPEAVAES